MAERATHAAGAPGAGRRAAGAHGAERHCPTCGARYPLDFLVCPKDATPLDLAGDSDDPLIGEVLAGTFLITGTLGEGGMGRVYEAEHVRMPRRFAIKVLLDQLSKHPNAVARFEREAQAVARIANPHVLEVVDVLRVQGRPCMVTELLEGEELADLLGRVGKLPLLTAISLCRQICHGLAAAHAVGVIHRDLKPSNLFLTAGDDGVPFVKILDFGIAKIADGAQLTRTGMVLGTPAYMAPEQARGSNTVDARVDVYSVGAVLYHMLTGAPPFAEGEPAMTLTKVLTEDPRRPRDLDRTIPEGVEALIQRAMARDPAQRLATVQDVERLLVAFDDAARGSSAAPPLSAARADRGAFATAQTVALQAQPGEAEDVTRRARRARPAAVAWTFLFSSFCGAAVLAASATTLRVVEPRAKVTETELTLFAVLALTTGVLLFVGGARMLVARWRSAPAIDRLGSGFRAALLWLVIPFSALTLAGRGYAVLGPTLPADVAGVVEIGTLALPVLLGLTMFAVALWRVRRG